MDESRRRRFTRAAAIPIGLLASGALVFAGSQSAFTATTDNAANTWTAGKAELKNNGAKATAAFDVSSTPAAFPATGGGTNLTIKPGDTGSKCIVVANSSSVNGQVRFFADSVAGSVNPPGNAALTTQLLVTVDFAAGQFLGCTAFPAAPTNVFGGAAGGLVGAMPTSYAGAAAGIWNPVGGGADDFGTYRVTWTLPNNTTNDAVQGGTATADFNWEIQST